VLSRPDDYVLIESADDVLRARREGRLGITFDIEGAGGIADQLSLIQLYYDLGVRWMLMAYNRRNLVGDGVHDADEQGLTPFGIEVVAEMERVGMVVCCSHTGVRTAQQVMEHATRPVIFSHSNAKALWDNRRNIDDGLMRACADTGGVVGINGLDQFLGPRGSGAEAMVRHIDYAIRLIGIDHVGIGLDFVFDPQEIVDFTAAMHAKYPDNPDYFEPMRFVPPERLVDVAAGLFALGYGDSDLAKVLGENHLRIARQVWK
jgi:membrane dipeptidase